MTLKQDIMTNIINIGALVLAATEWVVPILTLVTLIFALFWNAVKFIEWVHKDDGWRKIKKLLKGKRDSS